MKFNVKGKNFRDIDCLIFKDGRKRILVGADKKEYIPDGDHSIAVWKKTFKMVKDQKEYIDIDPEWDLKGFTLKEGSEANIQIL